MDDLLFRSRLNNPVVTGTPRVTPNTKSNSTAGSATDSESFQKVLEGQISTRQLSLSKHAAQRIEQRGIEVSESSMERLQQGIEIAQSKGLDDTLIIVDNSAFIVNAKNSTVITAIDANELKGNAITNINGTVIM